MDDRNFASLSPSLLARKGGAKPAMRPQHAPLTSSSAAQSLEDLGWNDMGADEEAPNHASEVAHLTPAPANPVTDAEAQVLAQQAQAALTVLQPAKPEVHRQQEELSQKLEAAQIVPEPDTVSAPEAAPRPPSSLLAKSAGKTMGADAGPVRSPRSALDRGKRAAFTLRLDADRHLKLRLACTLRNRSAQQLVTDALDELLGDMPDVEALAAQVSAQN